MTLGKHEEDGNKFFNFVYDYYEFIRSFKQLYDSEGREKGKKESLFSSKVVYRPEKCGIQTSAIDLNLRYQYNFEKASIANAKSKDQWLKMVREFTQFLAMAENVTLYTNDKEGDYLYADCDTAKHSDVLYYEDEDQGIDYRISFLDTEIPKINNTSALVNFIDGKDSVPVDETVTLVQIDIIRTYGDKKQNELKLTLLEDANDHLLSKKENILLFNIFKDRLSLAIFKLFEYILGNTNKLVGFDRNMTEEVLHGYVTVGYDFYD